MKDSVDTINKTWNDIDVLMNNSIWGQVQTMEQLSSYLTDECKELIHACGNRDLNNFYEEASDIIMLILCMAWKFDSNLNPINKLLNSVSQKLIRRYEHIYNTKNEIYRSENYNINIENSIWQEAKKIEKKISYLFCNNSNCYMYHKVNKGNMTIEDNTNNIIMCSACNTHGDLKSSSLFYGINNKKKMLEKIIQLVSQAQLHDIKEYFNRINNKKEEDFLVYLVNQIETHKVPLLDILEEKSDMKRCDINLFFDNLLQDYGNCMKDELLEFACCKNVSCIFYNQYKGKKIAIEDGNIRCKHCGSVFEFNNSVLLSNISLSKHRIFNQIAQIINIKEDIFRFNSKKQNIDEFIYSSILFDPIQYKNYIIYKYGIDDELVEQHIKEYLYNVKAEIHEKKEQLIPINFKNWEYEMITTISFAKEYEYEVIKCIYHYDQKGSIKDVTLDLDLNSRKHHSNQNKLIISKIATINSCFDYLSISDNVCKNLIINIRNIRDLFELNEIKKLKELLLIMFPNVQYSLEIVNDFKRIIQDLRQNYVSDIKFINVPLEYFILHLEDIVQMHEFNEIYNKCEFRILLNFFDSQTLANLDSKIDLFTEHLQHITIKLVRCNKDTQSVDSIDDLLFSQVCELLAGKGINYLISS